MLKLPKSLMLFRFRGRDLEVKCNYDGKCLRVPTNVVGKDELATPEFRDKKLNNGVYVSSIGAFYCNRDEYALHLERNKHQ